MPSNSSTLLSGQTALVTGASSGIGAATAVALAQAGARVGVNYLDRRESAEEIAEHIIKAGGHAVVLAADVSKEDDVRRMFSQLIDAFGRLDILIANAGLQRDAPVTEMTLEQWRTVIDVNLTGQFLCAREAIRQFLAQEASSRSKARGKIICMSSVHEVIPWAGHVNYATSKGGIMLMMKSLAQEVAEKKIRVNGIAPGAIKTNINKRVLVRSAGGESPAQAHPLWPNRGAGGHRQSRGMARIGRFRLCHRHDAVRRRRHDAIPGIPRGRLTATGVLFPPSNTTS